MTDDRELLGMAVYSAPVAAQSAEPMYFGLTNDGTWLSITQEQYENLKPEGRLKVYEAPPSREWKSLTDDEIDQCIDAAGRSYHRHKSTAGGQQLSPADAFDSHLAWAVQQALRAKNTGEQA